MLAILFFMPDSPKYLISQDKSSEAKKALQWLRGPQADIEPEMLHMINSAQDEKKIGSISLQELCTKRVYLQPFLIAMFGMFGQQFCGINAVFFYLQTIFEKANSTVHPSKFSKKNFT